MSPATRPAPSSERVILLDVLRGFALFGIGIVNIQQMFRPQEGPQLTAASPFADQAARFLLDLLLEGKFFPIYSFLFGLGVYVLVSRVEKSGGNVEQFFHRRLGALALIGVAHGTLLWSGDVLFAYAVTGYLLIHDSLRRSPSELLKSSIILLSIMPALTLVPAILSGGKAEFEGEIANDLAAEIRNYGQGDFVTVTLQRLKDYGVNCLASVLMATTLLGLFQFGYRAGLTGLLFDRPLLARYLAWSLPMGLLLSGVAAWLGLAHFHAELIGTWLWSLRSAAGTVGGVILALAYVCAVSLVWPRLAVLAPAGRMALTHYLTQSLILSTLAYGYGFGLYGQLGQAQLMGIAIALYGVQLVFSHWWLRHYQQGPVEAFWRRASRPPVPSRSDL